MKKTILLASLIGLATIASAQANSLRENLVAHPLTDMVVPFGAKATLVFPVQQGGGLLRPEITKEFRTQLASMCPTKWQVERSVHDDDKGQRMDWVDADKVYDADTIADGMVLLMSTTCGKLDRQEYRINGSRCVGEFTIRDVYSTGGSGRYPTGFFVLHDKEQAAVIKHPALNQAAADAKFESGPLPENTFLKTGTTDAWDVVVWAMDLCAARKGSPTFSIEDVNTKAVRTFTDPAAFNALVRKTRFTKGVAANPYTLACNGDKAFSVRGTKAVFGKPVATFANGVAALASNP
jgi:hypothetical protein